MKMQSVDVRLGEIIRSISRPERVESSREYRLLGARWYAEGLFEKDRKLGHQVKAKSLYRVQQGDFIYNRLFAWKGSFALVGPQFDGAYVSNEFPCFELDRSRIEPDFLKWWFCREGVWTQALGLSAGATPTSRNRFKEEHLLGLRIALPRVGEQRRIVARIEAIAARVHEIGSIRQREDVELQWMLLAVFRRLTHAAGRLPMREVAPLVRRPVQVELQASYSELGVRSFGKGTFHKPAVSGLEVGNKRIFHIEPGDLLFSNVFAWEGAIAVAKPEDAGRVGSHRFITCVPNPALASAPFLCFYFLTDEGLDSVRQASPGGALRNRTLGLEALGDIRVPVPDLKQQRWFEALQTRVESLRQLRLQSATQENALLRGTLERAFNGEL